MNTMLGRGDGDKMADNIFLEEKINYVIITHVKIKYVRRVVNGHNKKNGN